MTRVHLLHRQQGCVSATTRLTDEQPPHAVSARTQSLLLVCSGVYVSDIFLSNPFAGLSGLSEEAQSRLRTRLGVSASYSTGFTGIPVPLSTPHAPIPAAASFTNTGVLLTMDESLEDCPNSRQRPDIPLADCLHIGGDVSLVDSQGVPVLFHVLNALGTAAGDNALGREEACRIGKEGLSIALVRSAHSC